MGGCDMTRITVTGEAQLARRRAAMQLTFSQLLIGLVSEGWITEAEGDAWLAGAVPTPVSALIATLPMEQQFAAKARAISPSVVQRTNTLVSALATSEGKTPEELDNFFETYVNV